MTATGARPRRAAWLAVTLLLWAAPASPRAWYEDYQAAVKAIADGRCGEAVPLLRDDLLPRQPQGARRKRTYGMNYVDYLPHWQLGRAYWCLGERDRALAALEQAEGDGAVLETDQKTQFLALLGQARQTRRPTPEATTPKATTPTPAASPSAPVRAQTPVASATAAGSARTPAPPTPTPTPTPTVARPTATPASRATPSPTSPPARATVSTTPEATPRPSPAATAAATAVAELRTPVPLGTGGRGAGTLRPALRTALVKLYGDRVEDAVSELERQAAEDPADAATQAWLGVAYATLGYRSDDPQRAADLERRAGESFARARRIDAGLSLDERLTSPRIRALFDHAGR